MPRKALPLAAMAATVAVSMLPGCATVRNASLAPNPIVVASDDFETVWEATVQALDEDFEIEEENRLARQITTYPVTGATLVEPWRGDSVGFRARLESTLQTIRRFAIARVEPVPGGHEVVVEVYKELEFLDRPERQTGGQAAFPHDFPINRQREIIGPIAPPLGWISKGRDYDLEQQVIRRIERKLGGRRLLR